MSVMSNSRAKGILRNIRRRPNRHRATPQRPPTMRPGNRVRRSAVGLAATVVVLALGGGAGWSALDRGDTPAPASAAATVPADVAEATFLRELGYIGIALSPEQQDRALTIARKHVAHGHLEGMGTEMIADFKALVPGISDEKAESARIVLVHHFNAVTGKQ